MTSLNLGLEQPGDDELADQMFRLIRNALEATSGETLDSAGQKLADLLPEGDSDTAEAHGFCDLCIVVAEQIPYNHPKLADVVTLVQIVLDSPRFSVSEKKWKTAAKYRSWPYRAMGLPLGNEYDFLSPRVEERERGQFVSFFTFTALLCRAGILSSLILPVQLLRRALEGGNGMREPLGLLALDVEAMAATQIILILGRQILYDLLNKPLSDLRPWFAGPIYGDNRDPNCIDRWHFWQDNLRAVAAGKWDESEKSCISGETKQLALHASNAMDAIEKEVGTSRRQAA